MKRILIATALAVGLLAAAANDARANGFGPGYFNIGINLHANWGRGAGVLPAALRLSAAGGLWGRAARLSPSGAGLWLWRSDGRPWLRRAWRLRAGRLRHPIRLLRVLITRKAPLLLIGRRRRGRGRLANQGFPWTGRFLEGIFP